jgi:hypothetical protein
LVNFALCILEAVHGEGRPAGVRDKGGEKMLKMWRRGKGPDFMDVEKVRFFPHDKYDKKKILELLNGDSEYNHRLLEKDRDIKRVLKAIKKWYDKGL